MQMALAQFSPDSVGERGPGRELTASAGALMGPFRRGTPVLASAWATAGEEIQVVCHGDGVESASLRRFGASTGCAPGGRDRSPGAFGEAGITWVPDSPTGWCRPDPLGFASPRAAPPPGR